MVLPGAQNSPILLNVASMSDFTEKLSTIVGAEHVLTDEEARERWSFDAIDPFRLMARAHSTNARVDAVVRPANTEEIASVVRLANVIGMPVIAYGGGTGVMGSSSLQRRGRAIAYGAVAEPFS